jgi:glutamine cyclotransferase
MNLKSAGWIICLAACAALVSCTSKKKEETPVLSYSVIRVFPHDPTAFTQGLVIDRNKLFESTGRNGNSWISEVDIVTGKQEKRVTLDKKYFGEGITILGEKMYQLTWQNHTGFVYDLKTFARLREFQIDYEGWGITHDGTHLIVSDGTEKLHFIDTVTLKETSSVLVEDEFGKVTNLNELEFIEGSLFANQWQTNYLLKIDPATGQVTGRADLSVIADKIRATYPEADVLNGIAYEKKSKLVLVTGKLWPYLYALKWQSASKTE